MAVSASGTQVWNRFFFLRPCRPSPDHGEPTLPGQLV